MLSTRFFKALLAQLEAEASGAQKRVELYRRSLGAAQIKPSTAGILRSRIVFAVTSCLNATRAMPPPPRMPSRPPSPSRRNKARAVFGLQAALSLAKLYQSTTRPVDAHAVLAPALEGFCADAGNARDRRGAGAARGACGGGRGQGRGCAPRAPAASANGIRPSCDVVEGLRRRGNKGRLRARRRPSGEERRFLRALRGCLRSMDYGAAARANCNPRANRLRRSCGKRRPRGASQRPASRAAASLSSATISAISRRREHIVNGRSTSATPTMKRRRGNATASTRRTNATAILAPRIGSWAKSSARASSSTLRTGARPSSGIPRRWPFHSSSSANSKSCAATLRRR